MPNMLKRVGIGTVRAFLSLVSILAISVAGYRRDWAHSKHDQQCMFAVNFRDDTVKYDYSPVSEYYVVIPHVLITLAEILINITSTPIDTAQSSYRVKLNG